jgi:putative transposase
MDDSRVGSPDRQTHLRHLEAFFSALATNGLAINLEKCVFAAPSLEILGHTISATGAAPTADHAAEIENCPPPQDIKQLQRFLGMVNFYRRFFPNCAQVLKPLTDLLKGGGQNFAMDRHCSGGFPEGQMPPGGGGATSTPRPKC